MRSLRLLPLCLLLVSLALPGFGSRLSAADEDDKPRGEHFDNVPVPPGLTKEEIRDGVAEAFTARGWEVKQQTDRRVVGYIKQRGNEAFATVLLGPEEIEIYCEGWAINRRGDRVKPEQPSGWLANIRKDFINKFERMTRAR